MKLSVIMPVYNEKHTIKEIVRKVMNVNMEKEIIIVDDCSIDSTRDTLRRIDNNNIKVIYHDKNMGKGMAIRTGIKYVTGDIIIIQDADLEYEPEDYYELTRPIIEGKADVVYGSRELLKQNKWSYYRYAIGGRFLSWLTNLLYHSSITDEPTCYKVFKADILKSINLDCKKFEFCPEVTAKVLRRGIKIYEVPIHYYSRSIEQGKKIGLRDGLQAIWTLIKYRFIDKHSL
ncbi:MAG TPA: glycosyltransferase family 2 protein [bacterium]|nr:glycosyltransferase family 2 protein [bacterium]